MTTDQVTLDEAWETESGLVDEYDGTIVRSWFSTDARYQNGNVILLHWEIATTIPDATENIIEKFPVGAGWDSSDGGATVVHEQGKQKFNKNSIYGRIVDRATKADGNLHDVFPTLKSRGRPTQANIWEGLTFHFKREEFNYGGEIGTKERVMPQKFLGEGAQPQLAQAAAAAPAAAPAAAAAPAVEVDAVTNAKLVAAAKGAESFQAFLDAAMEIEGVTTNDALLATLVDEGATGFFATARA